MTGVDSSRSLVIGDHVAGLVAQALDAADDQSVPASVLTRKAIRIARLRSDWPGLVWLQMEVRTPGDDEARRATVEEVGTYFAPGKLQETWSNATERYLAQRSLDEDRVLVEPLPATEATIASIREQISHLRASQASPAPSFYDSEQADSERLALMADLLVREQMLARVRQRVADYLGQVERLILLGQASTDVWERNRDFVDRRLSEIAPLALEQFAAAYRRRAEGDPEARSHALASCRRVLKTLADAVYPATDVAERGIDGVERKMSDDKFIGRLCQFATERGRGKASRSLLATQIGELARKLDALNSLASKGVHASVTQIEVDQCLIHTYLIAGDILRIEADVRPLSPSSE